jgi:two-component SAPR family response regulator
MPKLCGLSFIENLKNNGCKIYNIALVSGYWTEKDISKAEKIDCTVFHKPIQPEELNRWLDICEKNIDPKRILSEICS